MKIEKIKPIPKYILALIKKEDKKHYPTQKRILQCYGDHDSKPSEEILDFVNKRWLPYANRQIKKIAA